MPELQPVNVELLTGNRTEAIPAALAERLAPSLASTVLPAGETRIPKWLAVLDEAYRTELATLANARPAGVRAATDEMKALTGNYRRLVKGLHEHLSPTADVALPNLKTMVEREAHEIHSIANIPLTPETLNVAWAEIKEGKTVSQALSKDSSVIGEARKSVGALRVALSQRAEKATEELFRLSTNQIKEATSEIAGMTDEAYRELLWHKQQKVKDVCTRDFSKIIDQMKAPELAGIDTAVLDTLAQQHYAWIEAHPELAVHEGFYQGQAVVLDALRTGSYPQDIPGVIAREVEGAGLPAKGPEDLAKVLGDPKPPLSAEQREKKRIGDQERRERGKQRLADAERRAEQAEARVQELEGQAKELTLGHAETQRLLEAEIAAHGKDTDLARELQARVDGQAATLEAKAQEIETLAQRSTTAEGTVKELAGERDVFDTAHASEMDAHGATKDKLSTTKSELEVAKAETVTEREARLAAEKLVEKTKAGLAAAKAPSSYYIPSYGGYTSSLSTESQLVKKEEQVIANAVEHGGATKLLEMGGIVGAIAAAGLAAPYLMNKAIIGVGIAKNNDEDNSKKPFVGDAKVEVGAISNPTTQEKTEWRAQVEKDDNSIGPDAAQDKVSGEKEWSKQLSSKSKTNRTAEFDRTDDSGHVAKHVEQRKNQSPDAEIKF